MSVPALGLPQDRIKRFESDLTVINTTVGNTFYHEFDRVPAVVEVRLVCVTANNGYRVGEEIPIESVWSNDGNNDDGGPYRTLRFNRETVLVWLGSGTYSFFAATTAPITANVVNITLTQWRIKVLCLDARPLS